MSPCFPLRKCHPGTCSSRESGTGPYSFPPGQAMACLTRERGVAQHRAGHARGFTLLEVVVALLIVALGLAAAVELTTLAAGNALTLQQKTLADWVAMNRLATLRTASILPAAGSASGHAQMGGNTFYWREEISGGALPQVRNVRIVVSEKIDGPALVSVHSSLAAALVPDAANAATAMP